MQPVVVNNYNLVAGNATSLVNAAAATTSSLLLATTLVPGVWQRRVLVTSSGNDSAIYFHIIGTNQAGFGASEYLAGANATSIQSNVDFLTVTSITPSNSSVAQTVASTAATVSAGVNGVGSSIWNIMNWHADPTNIACAGVIAAGGVNWSVQYTYDDPNNLASGTPYPFPFTHSILSAQTTSLDGQINGDITAARFLVNSGTGSLRGTFIQAGIGTP